VTYARPVGTAPTEPVALRIDLRRGSVFVAAGVLAAVNAEAGQIINTLTYQSPLEAATGLAGISAVIWAAMIAAWKIGSEGRQRFGGMSDSAVLAAILAFSFLPLSFAPQAGLLLCGVYLLATSRRHDASRRAAFVLLALTGPLIWGRILLNLFAAPILSLDAHIVGTVIGARVDGNVFDAAIGPQRFMVGDLCSSVHNISLAIVLWTTAAMLFDIRIDRRYVAVGVAMALFMFALNIARLAAIGLFPSHFTYLHFGTGAALFGWAGLVGAALLAGSGVMNAAARQR
jgi:hypothetical protein